MREYIVRKILYALLTIFAVVTTLFILFHVLPIDTPGRVISEALDEASRQRVEQAFNWPGLRKLLVQSAPSDDYPTLQATFLALTLLVIYLNLVLDVSHRYLSPRIKVQQRL